MAVRSIKIYTCDTCGVETLAKDDKTCGWLWAGTEAENKQQGFLPVVLGPKGNAPAPQKHGGIWCSIFCYTTWVKQELLAKYAREHALKEDDFGE